MFIINKQNDTYFLRINFAFILYNLFLLKFKIKKKYNLKINKINILILSENRFI
jgi:hypothetical protein